MTFGPAPHRTARAVLAAALAVWLAGCNSDAAKRRYVANGDRHLAEKRYAEAIVEYRNALQQDDRFGEARYKLAEALALSGNPEGAYTEYLRAADLVPDTEVQLKAATMLFIAGQFDDARGRVQRILERDPKNLDAQILLASASAGLRDLDTALSEIEAAVELDPTSAPAQTSLGLIRTEQGDPEAARIAFEKAVELDPKSVKARLALANFQWSTGLLARAEESLKTALTLDPKSLLANRALAVLYETTGRSKDAEAHLKVLVDAAPDPRMRFELVDYYIAQKRPADARILLTVMAEQRTTRADARTRLALLDYAAGRRAEAHAALDSVLKEQPSYPPTRIVKGRFLLAEGKPREALDHALAAVSAAPREVRAHYLLAVAQVANGQGLEAEKTFNEVLRLNPRAVAAQVQLSRLQLLRGETEPALEVAKAAYSVAPREPGARITLARSLLAVRDLTRAKEEIDRLLQDFPGSPDVQALSGTFGLIRHDTAGARRAFERALEIQPGSPAGLTGLTLLDVRANKLDAARARLEADAQGPPGPGRVAGAGRQGLPRLSRPRQGRARPARSHRSRPDRLRRLRAAR